MDPTCKGTLTDNELFSPIRLDVKLTASHFAYAKRRHIRPQPLQTVNGSASRVKEYLSQMLLPAVVSPENLPIQGTATPNSIYNPLPGAGASRFALYNTCCDSALLHGRTQ